MSLGTYNLVNRLGLALYILLEHVELGEYYSRLRYSFYSYNSAYYKQKSLTLGDCLST